MTGAVRETDLALPLLRRGKVRDVYQLPDDNLLFVATDRISAFDVVMQQPIPGKGRVLTLITDFWLRQIEDITAHHLITSSAKEIARRFPELEGSRAVWSGRAMLVKRTTPLPVECVVRGYISGSAWKEYRELGTLAGEELPRGLREADRLPAPIFSPATKAEEGHDENITFAAAAESVGVDVAEPLRALSLALYERGREIAARAGIIIADTKFEFGAAEGGTLLLIDEVMTPDSSRFWPESSYAPGRAQMSLDKQPVRDFLEELVTAGAWNREPPPPDLPSEVIEATAERYERIFETLTGVSPEVYAARLEAGR